jgi:hypothetical protein
MHIPKNSRAGGWLIPDLALSNAGARLAGAELNKEAVEIISKLQKEQDTFDKLRPDRDAPTSTYTTQCNCERCQRRREVEARIKLLRDVELANARCSCGSCKARREEIRNLEKQLGAVPETAKEPVAGTKMADQQEQAQPEPLVGMSKKVKTGSIATTYADIPNKEHRINDRDDIIPNRDHRRND